MMKRIGMLSVALLGLSGCFLIQGRAEMVKRDQGGGILALKGDHDKAMKDAERQMASNCPGGYQIVGEEMAKVGERTKGAEDTKYEKHGDSKEVESTTEEVKEYRITYACKSAGAEPTSGGEGG